MTKNKIWMVSGGTLLSFIIIARVVTRLLRVQGTDAWVLWGGLLVLGAAASALVHIYLSRKLAAAPPKAPPDDAIDVALDDARKKLAGMSRSKRVKIGNLPAVLVLGPAGSTKTSLVVLQSGLEPELLSGQVYRGEVISPTQTVNLWYAQGSILVEAGGDVLGDAARFSRLLEHLQPSPWRVALSRTKVQAARAVIVCFSCDELRSATSALTHARTLRASLLEVSKKLGIRLPVYVVFTKADRVPYFEDYVRSFTREEAQEVLGATLPALTDAPGSSYAESESQRLRGIFEHLFRSLALRRLTVLPRETREEIRAGAYEFPREFRKVADVAVQFLVELCKPSQLGLNPFLRGFYFTGVRAVVVADGAPVEVRTSNAGGPSVSIAATSVFNARELLANTPAPAVRQGARKVPEWVFVNRLFNGVIMQDRAAMRATAGGTRVNYARRALLAAAALAGVLLISGFTVSFARNSALEDSALDAVRGVAQPDGTDTGASAGQPLGSLDSLRATSARLREYERDGRPLSLTWGLYRGDDLLPPLRDVYFRRFEQLLWQQTRDALNASLRALPGEPGASTRYDRIYAALKAHLVTTSEHRRASPDSLPAVLLTYWPEAQTAAAQRQALALQQFGFFASELPYGNPMRDEQDAALVEKTRLLLRRLHGIDQFYDIMVGAASAKVPSIRFDQLFPPSAAVVRNSYSVPGAYSRAGWDLIQSDLRNVDRLAPEKWVVGDATLPPAERAQLAVDLRTRYLADYVRQWTQYLQAASVAGFGSIEDAVGKLTLLSGNQSPVLQALAVAAQNTAIDTMVVSPAFQPLHAVVPPTVTDQYLVEANKPYATALGTVLESVKQVPMTPPGPGQAAVVAQASANTAQASGAVRQLAQNFSTRGEAGAVGAAVRRLLEMPISNTADLLRAVPSAEANRKVAAFCQQFSQLTRKFPFSSGGADASIDEVSQALQGGTGALWTFYESALQDVIVQQGPRFAPRPGASPQPSQRFLTFFNAAADVSRALYDENGAGPELVFAIRPELTTEISEVTITVDRRSEVFTPTSAAGRTFTWVGTSARDVRISGRIGGAQVTLFQPAPGPWAIFRLFHQGEWQPRGSGHYGVRWQIPNRSGSLTADVSFAGGVPIFMPRHLDRLECVSRIAS
jgi:type VI secretion system protein ImpL